MLLTKNDYTKAIRALRQTNIVSPENKIKKDFTGKLCSMGPDTVNMGLPGAIALYESKPGEDENDAGQQKIMLCQAILKLMPESTNEHILLYHYIKDKYPGDPDKTQFYFDKALMSLKMTIRLFEEK
jgi:hypothetical protein